MTVRVRIRPTVCTNRAMDVIAPCLKALDREGLAADTIVVLSGLTPTVCSDRAREIEHLVPEVTILSERQGGLSRARNLALASVASEEIVAFVDDDAVVAQSWHPSMVMAWSEADVATAAVGGPIFPEFLAPRPAWLSDRLLRGLSILELGPEPKFLDGPEGYLFGANLSVRPEPALRLGGFDPARGPIGSGPGFGDDIELQERLVRAGFRIRYEPAIAVAHRIPPERLRRRSMLERRFAQGREQARAVAGPQYASALRGIAAGASRSARYTWQRRPDVAMDHLAYSLQSAGVLRELLIG